MNIVVLLLFAIMPTTSSFTCNLFYGAASTKGELKGLNLTACNATISQWDAELAAGRACAIATSGCTLRTPACYSRETCNGTTCYQDMTLQNGVWEAYGMCDTHGGINTFGKTTFMSSKTSFAMTNGDVMRCTTDNCNTWFIGGLSDANRLAAPTIMAAVITFFVTAHAFSQSLCVSC